MIDAGADAVVGGHPHVVQGAEVYQGRPIVYSLGNFVFDGFEPGPGREGWVLRLTVDRTGVVRWDTVVARLDDDGSPHPDPDATAPCGEAGALQVRACRVGAR
jgi:poly-gamma-glutamate synthesis protein (capsule biosynthesis protein)